MLDGKKENEKEYFKKIFERHSALLIQGKDLILN